MKTVLKLHYVKLQLRYGKMPIKSLVLPYYPSQPRVNVPGGTMYIKYYIQKSTFVVDFLLLLLPLWESVIVLCFVVGYFTSIPILQSS